MITLQYLEPGHQIQNISSQAARNKLRAAVDILPIDCLLLGWDLPISLADVCQEETSRAGIDYYRWQPLLTGDGTLFPKEAWRTQNMNGESLSGFRGLPEFTFVCPNHPGARSAIFSHLRDVIQSGVYAGIFLDRMRFPSPAGDLVGKLACFCEHCQQAAARFGLALEDVRHYLLKNGPIQILETFKNPACANPLAAFLKFRQHTITQFVGEAAKMIRSAGMAVGLDCFSPSLMPLVGQDLVPLSAFADWTKLMIYGHARGPATLPFEVNALAQWVIASSTASETEALNMITDCFSLPLPRACSKLLSSGLSSTTLAAEFNLGRLSRSRGKLLAGIELVEIPGVSELGDSQIEADLSALKSVHADGLSLSWDLWHMPLERLALVAQVWGID